MRIFQRFFLIASVCSLACNAKSATAPSSVTSPLTTVQDAKSGSSLAILSGTVTVDGFVHSSPRVNVTLHGTSGLRMNGLNNNGEPVLWAGCVEACTPGASYPIDTTLGALFGPIRVLGHEYQLNPYSLSTGNLTFIGEPLVVPPYTAAATASTSVPFTLGGDVASLFLETSPDVVARYLLTGSGTATFTFHQSLLPEGGLWEITGAVFTFQ